MKQQSKTVQAAAARLWARMAKAAAQRAISKIACDNANAAEQLADTAIGWMERSSAEAIRWHYDDPRLS